MKKAIIIGGIILLLSTATFFYLRKQKDILVDETTFKVVGIVPQKLDLNETILLLSVRVDNNSTLQATVQTIDIDIFLNGVSVANISKSKDWVLPAKGYTVIDDIEVSFSPMEIYNDLFDIAKLSLKLRDANISIKGKTDVKIGVATIHPKFSYDTTGKELFSKPKTT